jgi:hypothetical protein
MHALRRHFPSVTALETGARILNLRETCAAMRSPMLRAMPLLATSPSLQPVRGDKRRLVLIGVAIALAFGAVAAWSATRPGGYEQVRSGCVTITIPNSMGGAMLHACGSQARLMCRSAAGHDDRLSLLIRPHCRAADLH